MTNPQPSAATPDLRGFIRQVCRRGRAASRGQAV
ncbi:hypothetical protein [Frigoribacterium sp. CFBP 8754]